MSKFNGTPRRKHINNFVSENLFDALSYCTPKALKENAFDTIKNANTHDEMVVAVKKICTNIWKTK